MFLKYGFEKPQRAQRDTEAVKEKNNNSL